MSGFVRLERRNAQAPGSPSLDSDVLSASLFPSSASALDASPNGWVIFSPQISAIHEEASAANVEPLAAIEPLDLNDTHEDAEENLYTSMKSSRTLELPAHNGTGSFSKGAASQGPSLDLFERINSWRIDQLEFYSSSETGGQESSRVSAWRWLKETASLSLHSLLDWDEQTIDALFSQDFVAKDGSDEKTLNSSSFSPASHIQNAREYGPPGWENKMLKHTRRHWKDVPYSESQFLLTLFAKFIDWSQGLHYYDHSPRYSHGHRRIDANAGHSYHFPEIQGSIASVTSTFGGHAWSDTWDSTTSSAGVAVA